MCVCVITARGSRSAVFVCVCVTPSDRHTHTLTHTVHAPNTHERMPPCAELPQHAVLLAHLLSIVEAGTVTVPLQQSDPGLTNQGYIRAFIIQLLQQTFPHLQGSVLRACACVGVVNICLYVDIMWVSLPPTGLTHTRTQTQDLALACWVTRLHPRMCAGRR